MRIKVSRVGVFGMGKDKLRLFLGGLDVSPRGVRYLYVCVPKVPKYPMAVAIVCTQGGEMESRAGVQGINRWE